MTAQPDPAADPAALRARVAALEALARELLDAYRPYPHEDSGYWNVPVPVSDEEMARRRAVLDGGQG